MSPALFKKLVRHIKNTGRYEPITVRSHPKQQGKFQLVNGHNRLNALKELGHDKALCTVWNLSDAEARLYLATLNRLSGKEIPERRELLLESLTKDFAQEDLVCLLPDPAEYIKLLFKFENELAAAIPVFEKIEEIPMMLNFYLDRVKAETVEKAIGIVIRTNDNISSNSDALWFLADNFLKSNQTIPKSRG